MKIEHLQYFIVLANSSSISKAAEKLFISQQQLNRIITSLEEEVQTKLLSRTTNGVSLTEEGQDFLLPMREILSASILPEKPLLSAPKSGQFSSADAAGRMQSLFDPLFVHLCQ